jgi:hypothetical protein
LLDFESDQKQLLARARHNGPLDCYY